MHIGFFTDSYLPRLDGIAISVETFRKNLEDLGHKVYVFCPERPGPFQPPSPRIYRFKSLPALLYDEYRNTFPFTPKNIKTIEKLQLDIVHIHTPLQIGILGHYIAHKFKIPLVTTCHSDPGLFQEYGWLKNVISIVAGITLLMPQQNNHRKLINPTNFNSVLKSYLNQYALIIAPSDKIKKSLIRLGVKARTEIIATSFDTSLIPKASKRFSQRQKLGLSSHVVFISTSRHVKEKRLDFILNAFAITARNHPEYFLLLIGDGPKNTELRNLTKNLGINQQVKFLGKLERGDLIACLQAADILVSASLRETQGLVINEAAAVGLPVIALESDINPILQDNKTGLIPSNNIKDYAAAMQQLASNPDMRRQFGVLAKKLAEKYTPINQAKRLEKLYLELTPK